MNFDLFNPQTGAPEHAKALALFPALQAYSRGLGQTPLIEVPGPAGGAGIWAKLESGNPSGSIKDRVAFGLFCDAINRHDFGAAPLKLLDASGGNMARALAHLGHVCDIEVQVVIPDSASESLLEALRISQARVTLVDHRHFLLGIVARSQQIAQQEPGWTLLSQHLNLVNIAVHQHHTGAELVRQLAGRHVGAWVAAIGTGGTLTGVSLALLASYPSLQIVACTPAELPFGTMDPPNGNERFAGAGGLGYGFRQPFIALLPSPLSCQTVGREASLRAMFEFSERTGLSIGGSSAANWLAACRVAAGLAPTQTVVTVFADAGSDAERERGRALSRQWVPELEEV